MCCRCEDAATRVFAGSPAHVEPARRAGLPTSVCAGSRRACTIIITRASGGACARVDARAIALKVSRVDGIATRRPAGAIVVAGANGCNCWGCNTIARDFANRWAAHEVSGTSSRIRIPVFVKAVRIIANAVAYPKLRYHSTIRRDGRVDGAVVHLRREVFTWIVT